MFWIFIFCLFFGSPVGYFVVQQVDRRHQRKLEEDKHRRKLELASKKEKIDE